MQIIEGKPDTEVIAAKVLLEYSPSGVAVNHALRHLYLSNSAKSCIDVRDLSTGALVAMFPLAPGTNPGSIGVDSVRGRLYIILAAGSSKNLLYVIKDDATHL